MVVVVETRIPVVGTMLVDEVGEEVFAQLVWQRMCQSVTTVSPVDPQNTRDKIVHVMYRMGL